MRQIQEGGRKLPGVQKKLHDLLENPDENDWKEKYEEEHTAFGNYKKDLEAANAKKSKQDAYRAILKEIGVSGNRIESIIKSTNVDELKIKDGKLDNSEELMKAAKEE